MILVRARIVLSRTMWKKELSLAKVLSVVVRSWVNHSPWEPERSVSDCWEALELQKQAVVSPQEMRHCCGLRRQRKYSRPTLGSNTTNSVAFRTTKSLAGLEMNPTRRQSRRLTKTCRSTSTTTP